MGEAPCGTDATAFGALAGILTPFFDSPLRERTEQFANLTAYVDRMMLQYYPEFAWTPLQQAKRRDAQPAERGLALQCGQLRLQFGDPRVARGQRRRHIGRIELLRNVLRAVGVPRRDPEQDHLFGPRLVALRHQRLQSAPDRHPPRAPRPRS